MDWNEQGEGPSNEYDEKLHAKGRMSAVIPGETEVGQRRQTKQVNDLIK